MSLEGHNPTKEEKENHIKTNKTAGWIGASTRAELSTTQQLTPVGALLNNSRRSDWSINTASHLQSQSQMQQKQRARNTHQTIHTHVVAENLRT